MKARDGKLDSFHKDKGNIEKDDRSILNIELESMYICYTFV